MKDQLKKVLTYLFIVLHALLTAVNYEIFVFPNNFAPAGIGGICTMIQYVFDIRVSYLSLVINIPLAIAVYFLVSKKVALRAMTYQVFFSLFLWIFDHMDISALTYQTASSTILGPLIGGVVMGWSCAMLLRVSSHHAGVYFISSIVYKYRPDFRFSWVTFTLNIAVAVTSYFVYGFNIEPVVLCILYCFSSALVNDMVSKGGRQAMRFEITTPNPENLRKAIVEELHHTATILPGKGLYKGRETNVVICVINKAQAAQLNAFLRTQPNTFAVVSQVGQVLGNFKHIDVHGTPEADYLDHGDSEVN